MRSAKPCTAPSGTLTHAWSTIGLEHQQHTWTWEELLQTKTQRRNDAFKTLRHEMGMNREKHAAPQQHSQKRGDRWSITVYLFANCVPNVQLAILENKCLGLVFYYLLSYFLTLKCNEPVAPIIKSKFNQEF